MSTINKSLLVLMPFILFISSCSSPTSDNYSSLVKKLLDDKLPILSYNHSIDILNYASSTRQQCLGAFYLSSLVFDTLHAKNEDMQAIMTQVEENEDNIKSILVRGKQFLRKIIAEKKPRPNFKLHSSDKQLLELNNCS